MSEAKGVYTEDVSETKPQLFSSGCKILDQSIGGGWAIGRVVHIAGDSSTGKTLLAIEAAANLKRKFPTGLVIYSEIEAAFDRDYAVTIGLPGDSEVNVGGRIRTIEDLYKHIEKTLDRISKTKQECLYIVDSMDALSDAAEMDAEFDAGTYGAAKPKQIGKLFRMIVDRVEKSNMCLMIISQTRDRIGVAFGDKISISGGKALRFYSSQSIMLHHRGRIKQTKRSVTRPIGVSIKSCCTKSKLCSPFREASFDILFGYGVDDVSASVNWLAEVKLLSKLQEVLPLDGVSKEEIDADISNDPDEVIEDENTGAKKVSTKAGKKWLATLNKLDDINFQVIKEKLDNKVIETWNEVESWFSQPKRKYN
jgi:recombination protein RecA